MEGFIMKKNFIVKVMTLVMAATMALTPVTASASEKKVVTAKEFKSSEMSFYSDDYEEFNSKGWMNYVASLDGCYQENGNKIYTALNGKTVTFKKTGNYSVIVGGKTAKKDEGTFKFVAPKTGTYRFTFSVKENVAGGRVYIDQNAGVGLFCKVNYKNGKGYVTNGKSTMFLLASKGCAYLPKNGSLGDYAIKEVTSEMRTITGSVKLKKGQKIALTARSSSADYNEDSECAYNFVGYDLKITKTK